MYVKLEYCTMYIGALAWASLTSAIRPTQGILSFAFPLGLASALLTSTHTHLFSTWPDHAPIASHSGNGASHSSISASLCRQSHRPACLPIPRHSREHERASIC
ncbi:hypothetical protein LZ32DRAFT_445409 [Colletotrichum eremochloae]|nr:hypothetical protein LZ32DRAFT_445409 [Colletotrichum eremochloae]